MGNIYLKIYFLGLNMPIRLIGELLKIKKDDKQKMLFNLISISVDLQ